MENKEQETSLESSQSRVKKPLFTKQQKAVLSGFALILMSLAGVYAFLYLSSPENIRSPKLEHAHLRMQYFVDGKAIDFGQDKFQQDYVKGQCVAEFPKEPIHFHDNRDQFVHLHWQGVTGAQLIGYYGNNLGGYDKALGYKQNRLSDWQKIESHTDALVDSQESNTWVYTMGENGLAKRSIEDFLTQNLEQFFGVKSRFKAPHTSASSGLFTKVHAQTQNPEDSELQRIQNLIGDLAIFVQDEEPSKEQLKTAESSYIALDDSVCGG